MYISLCSKHKREGEREGGEGGMRKKWKRETGETSLAG